MNDDAPYLTAQEVADRLGISLHSACDMIRNQEVPGVLRARKPMRVSRAAFDSWIGGRT